VFSHGRSGGELTRPTHAALTSNGKCNCNARPRKCRAGPSPTATPLATLRFLTRTKHQFRKNFFAGFNITLTDTRLRRDRRARRIQTFPSWRVAMHEITDTHASPARCHAIRTAARRKFERHAAKAAIPLPTCEQCGEAIPAARRLASPTSWARRFCGNTCRQAAWRDRHGA
jgi:RNA polymerase-binding transcription factor DksA